MFKSKKQQIIYKPEYKDFLLKVINLKKQYKPKMKPAIQGLNFEVKRGEFHAFVGGNGAGKTTTIKSIVGAYARFEGEIYISGWSNRTVESKKHLGYIPEAARFPEGMTTKQYLMDLCSISGLNKKEAIEFVDKQLELTHMSNLASKSPNTFSSGQKKKILLIQSLINNPNLLIMDEPAANLDPTSRIEFFDTLKQLQNQGKSIFISSHILSEVEKYADSATILDGGKIVFTGSIKELLQQSKNIYNFATNDEKFLTNYLTKNKISYELRNKGKQKIFRVKLRTEKEVNELVTLLLNKKKLNLFEKYIPSLEELYREYVVHGSVHTMKKID